MRIRQQTKSSVANAIAILIVLITGIEVCAADLADPNAKNSDRWTPFQRLIGHWKGIGHGPAGESVHESEWKLVFNGTFLQRKSSSKATGDHHQDIGLISYDQSRKKYIYRAFHSEGFVNRYVAEFSSDGRRIVFTSEAIENGPKDLKAMEIVELKNGKLETTLKLASGDGPFVVCASGKLERVEFDDKD